MIIREISKLKYHIAEQSRRMTGKMFRRRSGGWRGWERNWMFRQSSVSKVWWSCPFAEQFPLCAEKRRPESFYQKLVFLTNSIFQLFLKLTSQIAPKLQRSINYLSTSVLENCYTHLSIKPLASLYQHSCLFLHSVFCVKSFKLNHGFHRFCQRCWPHSYVPNLAFIIPLWNYTPNITTVSQLKTINARLL